MRMRGRSGCSVLRFLIICGGQVSDIVQYVSREGDTNVYCSLTNDDLMEPSLDQSTTQVLQLFPGLHEQIPARWWKLDRDTFARVTGPDM